MHFNPLVFCRVLEGIIVGTAMLGQAVAFTPDYQKAKLAAARIFEILDHQSEIDVFSQEGKILVSFVNL